MKTGALKTTIWYKCLVCQRCFQFPTALVVHRKKSPCRFQYKKIHKERTKWPFETRPLEILDLEEALHFTKVSQQLLISPKTINKVQESTLELTERYSNEAKSSNLTLTRNDEQSKYNCYFCSSVFTNFEDLQTHMVHHTREESEKRKPGALDFDNCKKDCVRSDEVKLHNIPISGKFICNLCQKSYCTKQYLNLHISTIHERLKPYSCKECPKTFGQSNNLRIHVSAVHQGLKPYSCKQCLKSYSTKQNCKSHVCHFHKVVKKA